MFNPLGKTRKNLRGEVGNQPYDGQLTVYYRIDSLYIELPVWIMSEHMIVIVIVINSEFNGLVPYWSTILATKVLVKKIGLHVAYCTDSFT